MSIYLISIHTYRYYHVLRKLLLHFHQWIQFQSKALSMTPRFPWCTLDVIAGCWNSLLTYAELISSSTLKGRIHSCGRSSCNETTGHQKILFLYRLCIEIQQNAFMYKLILHSYCSQYSRRHHKHLPHSQHRKHSFNRRLGSKNVILYKKP